MDLTFGFRFDRDTRAALVGSGGKTSALFHLARAFKSTVVLSTTTHLALEQTNLADRHVILQDASELPADRESYEGLVVLITGDELAKEPRVGGVSDSVLGAILDLVDKWQVPLLIEADGARRLPLKAPAAHEPPIPSFVNSVIVCAGLSGLEKPLSDTVVHRPEIFGDIAGMDPGETITPSDLKRVLLSPRGGLKDIPQGARKIALLNQADVLADMKAVDPMVEELLSAYQAVGLTALARDHVYAVHEPVAGIVLAGGGSQRYGKTKQLLCWQGDPLVVHAAKTALKAGLDPVWVVTGADHNAVEKALAPLPVKTVHNPDWEKGQSTSVKAGINVLPSHVGGVLFLLADQPHIPPELVKALRVAHAESHAPIVATMVGEHRANPVLFDRRLFPAFQSLRGDVGGRVLFERYQPLFVPWEDSAITLDVDTPEDYRRLKEIVDQD